MPDLHPRRTQRYVAIVLRSVITAAVVFVGAMAAGVYVTNNVLTKVYFAKATMEVQPEAVHPEAASDRPMASLRSPSTEVELESIESPEVMRKVVSTLGLDKAWGERLDSSSEPLAEEDAVRLLRDHLKPNFKHGTNVIEVRASSDDPEEAAAIANAVVDAYQATRNAHAPPGAEAAASPVKILARADVPTEPSRPIKRICYATSAAVAALLSVLITCSLEGCMLIARAGETARELAPAQ